MKFLFQVTHLTQINYIFLTISLDTLEIKRPKTMKKKISYEEKHAPLLLPKGPLSSKEQK